MPLTEQEINDRLHAKGFTKASYSRMIKRTRSAVTQLCQGKIQGPLRERFAKFLGVDESMLPKKDRETN